MYLCHVFYINIVNVSVSCGVCVRVCLHRLHWSQAWIFLMHVVILVVLYFISSY